MRCLSSMVNLITVTTLLLTSSLHRCQQTIFKKNTNYFTLIESAFHQLFCLKFLFKLLTLSRVSILTRDIDIANLSVRPPMFCRRLQRLYSYAYVIRPARLCGHTYGTLTLTSTQFAPPLSFSTPTAPPSLRLRRSDLDFEIDCLSHSMLKEKTKKFFNLKCKMALQNRFRYISTRLSYATVSDLPFIARQHTDARY